MVGEVVGIGGDIAREVDDARLLYYVAARVIDVSRGAGLVGDTGEPADAEAGRRLVIAVGSAAGLDDLRRQAIGRIPG